MSRIVCVVIISLFAFIAAFGQMDYAPKREPLPDSNAEPPKSPIGNPGVPMMTGVSVPQPLNAIKITAKVEVPKWNQVLVAASSQAILMALETESVPLREGMYVKKNQLLGSLDNRELSSQRNEALASLNYSIAEQQDKTSIKFYAQTVHFAMAELKRFRSANTKSPGSFSESDIHKAELDISRSEAQLENEQHRQEVIKVEEVKAKEASLKVVDVRIDLRRLTAPIEGTITKINKSVGEWLREGDGILEITNLSTLRIECKIDSDLYTLHDVGNKPATIRLSMPNGKVEEFSGKVEFVLEKIEFDKTFTVFVEVQNRKSGDYWILLPGHEVTATIHL